jgi:hypothetical protein
VFETYPMLGKLREAERRREARRLQVGVPIRPRRTVQRTFVPTLVALAVSTLAVGACAANSGAAPATTSDPQLETLAHAREIRVEINARNRGVRARTPAVTEATTTGVIESFTLLTPDMLEARSVPADNGIYFAVCPARATCPYPARRFARPAADFPSRRLALELALRTFLETSATVVAVSLPTPRFILFIVERDELAREMDIPALANALGANPAHAPAAGLRQSVDQFTRPRIFVALGLEPAAGGRESLSAVPRWPTVAALDEGGAAIGPTPMPSMDGS